MITPKELYLNNFLSHEKSCFKFKNGKATMIEGQNNSDKGQISNGSGKSAVIEGIAVGLLGTPLRDVSVKDLVRKGTKSAEIRLILNNTKTKQDITITRRVFSNTKSSQVTIELDGQEITDLVSVRDKDDWILKLIDIRKNDLLNYFLISKEKYTSFFNMSDNAKKEVIGRFSQSNLIDPAYDIIDEKVTEKQTLVDQKQRQIDVETGKQTVHEETLKQLKDDSSIDFETVKQNKIDQFNKAIQAKETTKETYLKQKQKRSDDIQLDNKALSDNPLIDNSSKIKKLLEDKKTHKNTITELRSEEKETNQFKIDIQKSLAGVIQCPNCNHEFSLTDDSFDIEESRKVQDELEQLEQQITKEIEQFNGKIDEIDDQIELLENAESARRSLRRTIENRIDANQRSLRIIERQISSVEADIESYNQSIDIVKNEVIPNYQQSINDTSIKLDECKSNIDTFTQEKENLSLELFKQKEWDGIFTKFKTHLANKSISVIQTYCNEWLQRMKSGLSIKLEGYKINRNGSIREKITCQVLRDGVDEGSLSMFSSGEKARIEIAMILALQKLINTNSSGGLDLCFLDEAIESVDSEGILSIMNTLNTLNQTIIVVTHGTLDQHYPHKYVVVKDKGKSTIV